MLVPVVNWQGAMFGGFDGVGACRNTKWLEIEIIKTAIFIPKDLNAAILRQI
ncbi:MAG: hypothetical protein ACLSCV_12395 [Acutalibacteraceae bacterium]